MTQFKAHFEVFKESSIFSGINLASLASMVKFSKSKKLHRKNFLFQRGDRNRMKLYYLAKGDLRFVFSTVKLKSKINNRMGDEVAKLYDLNSQLNTFVLDTIR